MSVGTADTFGFESLPLDGVDGGTSVLLTGDDTAALESVFYRLLAPGDDEAAVVLSTEDRGRTVQRNVGDVVRGGDSRTQVLTCEGRSSGADVTCVDDLADLTTLGMEYSTQVAQAGQDASDVRTGIFVCSTICTAVDDTRSVYRFLNSTFLTELRRSKGLGVVALDTDSDMGSDIDSVVAGMETSLTGRIHVEDASRTGATLSVSGLGNGAQTVDVSF